MTVTSRGAVLVVLLWLRAWTDVLRSLPRLGTQEVNRILFALSVV